MEKQGYIAEVQVDGNWLTIDQEPWQADSVEDAARKLRDNIREDAYNASEGCHPQPGDLVQVCELDGDGMVTAVRNFTA